MSWPTQATWSVVPFFGVARGAGHRADCRAQIPSLPVLGDYRSLNDIRHYVGRLCRSLARHWIYRGSLLPFTCLMVVLAIWHWSEGTISVNSVSTPRVEAFYWRAITFSQILGTALGDWIAGADSGMKGARSS